jgi:hypothetical protein
MIDSSDASLQDEMSRKVLTSLRMIKIRDAGKKTTRERKAWDCPSCKLLLKMASMQFR